MDIKINDLSASEKEIEVTYTYEEIKNDIDAEILKQTKKIQIPGFRKGKVPLPMIKKMYGDALEYDASEKVSNDKFWDISKERHLHPIGQPALTDIKFNPGVDLSFKVKYEVVPEIEVKDYTGNEIEIPDFHIHDEDIEHEVEHIIKANRELTDADVVGDDRNYMLKVDFIRIDENGGPFEGAKPENLQLDLTNENVQPEIVENSKGKKTGEDFTFGFTDERTIKNAEGEEEKVTEHFEFKGTIKEIKKINEPALDEELVKKVTKERISSPDEFKLEIKKDIEAYYEQRQNELLNSRLISVITEKNEFTPPQTLINNVLQDMLKREEEQFKKQGGKKFDRTEAANRLKQQAENEVRWYLLKNAIQKKENITFDEQELTTLAEKDAEKTGIPVDKLLNYYKQSGHGERLIDNKLFDFLKENNTIKKVASHNHNNEEEHVHE